MIYLDIETLPTTNDLVIDRVKAKIKAPSNYKDPDKIAAYIESGVDEAVHKTGLSGLFGQVLCFGYARDDGEPHTLYLNDFVSEKDMLHKIRVILTDGLSTRVQGYCTETLVGHNAAGFDIPFLSQRMMVNGLKPLFRHGSKPWDLSIEDTMLMFAAGSKNYASLDNLCLAFGVESPKTDLDGSKVYQAYLDGRHDDIQEYCKADVIATRSIHLRMNVLSIREQQEAA